MSPSGVSDAERLARAGLSRVAEPGVEGGRTTLLAHVARHGGLPVWEALRHGHGGLELELPLNDGARERLVEARPERDLELLERVGGRLVCPGDPEWPPALADLGPWQPVALWVRGEGDLRLACRRSVSIVGSRAATAYGGHVAGELAAGLSDRGWAVMSGGAYGIDGAAHRGALAVGGLTVASLACGVDKAYPPGHHELFGQILAEGVLMSEWPPGCAPQRHRFLARNRVIAAASAGTVVVEAAARSGALNTARHAARLGRAVMVVPGLVTSAMSVGCHSLARTVEGVRLVTGAADVLEEVGRLGADLAPVPRGPHRVGDGLSAPVRRVLEAVPAVRPAGPAGIAVAAGVDTTTVGRALPQLEVAGLVERVAAGYRLTRQARADRVSVAAGQLSLETGVAAPGVPP